MNIVKSKSGIRFNSRLEFQASIFWTNYEFHYILFNFSTNKLCKIRPEDAMYEELFYEDYEENMKNMPDSYFTWTEIPSSNFRINFVTDSSRNFYGFDLEWRCKNRSSINIYFSLLPFLIILTVAMAIRKTFFLKNWNWPMY